MGRNMKGKREIRAQALGGAAFVVVFPAAKIRFFHLN
jgi:hypothetical protein